jgi:hypothetical protein
MSGGVHDCEYWRWNCRQFLPSGRTNVGMPNDKNTQNEREIRFTLLENALDSIAFGIQRIASPETKRDLKQGVLNVDAGVELLLKDKAAPRRLDVAVHETRFCR